jgi:predicted extracellular nuclease
VITAIARNGFWVQDPQPDDDERTSEGVFVFTNSAPDSALEVGDAVLVSGHVAEFRADPTGLSTTEISSPRITVTGTGSITPTIVGQGGRVPPNQTIEDDASGDVEAQDAFDPSSDGIDFHESLEGMLVQINDAVASGPSVAFGEISVLADGGAGASPLTSRGGILVTPEDFNPERLILDDAILPATTPMPTNVDVRDGLGTVQAVVDYSFGNFKYEVTKPPVRTSGGLQREITDAAKPHQLAVASFNVENLDPTDPPSKFDRLASILVTNLRSPDLVAVEEIQDNTGPATDPSTDASLTWQELIAAVEAVGGPRYEYRQIDPEYGTDGGEPGGNIRQGFLYRTDRGLSFVDRPGGTATTPTEEDATQPGAQLTLSPGRIDPADPAFNNSRKPLAGEFRWEGRPLFVVANHFNSKGGDDPLFGRRQPPVRSSEVQRHQQAAVVNAFVSSLEDADKQANVVVLGDLNDFDFSETLSILQGDELVNLIDTLPLSERYSYVFDGNSQVLDQILVSKPLRPAAEYDSVHVNAEFHDQDSDHDPQVARLRVEGKPAKGD